LEKGKLITIAPGIDPEGSVSYEFPGVPIDVHINTPGVTIVERPSAGNGWSRISFRSSVKRKMVVSINWSTQK